jgi:hypothetical protein
MVFDMVIVSEDHSDDDKNDRVIGVAVFENNTILRAGGEIYRMADCISDAAAGKMRDIFRQNDLPCDVKYHLVVHGSG